LKKDDVPRLNFHNNNPTEAWDKADETPTVDVIESKKNGN
jgi:hypothetical protein